MHRRIPRRQPLRQLLEALGLALPDKILTPQEWLFEATGRSNYEKPTPRPAPTMRYDQYQRLQKRRRKAKRTYRRHDCLKGAYPWKNAA